MNKNTRRTFSRGNRTVKRFKGNHENDECRPFRQRPLFHLHETTGSIGSIISKAASNNLQNKDLRNMIVVYFGIPINVTSEFDGKRRTLMRRHLPFYQTTASSETNKEFPWLKDTWLPCFGLGKKGKHEHIFKLSGLKSYQGAIGKWPQFLEQQKRLHNKMRKSNEPLYTMDIISFKNEDGTITLVDEDIFFKAVSARCPSWDLLRISAGIGEGFWKKALLFRQFVLTDSQRNRTFQEDKSFSLDHIRKTKVMLTSEVYKDRVDDDYSLDLLRCRLSDIPELQIVTEEGKETELVDFKA